MVLVEYLLSGILSSDLICMFQHLGVLCLAVRAVGGLQTFASCGFAGKLLFLLRCLLCGSRLLLSFFRVAVGHVGVSTVRAPHHLVSKRGEVGLVVSSYLFHHVWGFADVYVDPLHQLGAPPVDG